MQNNKAQYLEKSIVCLLLIFISNIILAQDKDLFSKELFINGKDTLRYRLLLPKNFSEDKQYPLVLFLHGSGERGDDNTKQLVHGSKLFLDNYQSNTFPAIVIFPQCPKEDYWSNVKRDYSKTGLKKFKYKRKGKPTKAMQLVLDLMDSITSKPFINKSQIYVGGLSMGGMGTFDILKRKPNMFAAAFPICGGGNPKSVCKYANKVAVWVFDGGKDNIVDPYFSLRMVTALREQGADVKLSYFENDNHNSWDSALSEPNLLPWLFSNIKNQQ